MLSLCSVCIYIDLKGIVRETSSSFHETVNARCCFNNLLTTRNFYLAKITASVSRMATLMENLCPASGQYNDMVAKGA